MTSRWWMTSRTIETSKGGAPLALDRQDDLRPLLAPDLVSGRVERQAVQRGAVDGHDRRRRASPAFSAGEPSSGATTTSRQSGPNVDAVDSSRPSALVGPDLGPDALELAGDALQADWYSSDVRYVE